MKAILLNNGGYTGLDGIDFPVEVRCYIEPPDDTTPAYILVDVSRRELVRVGADPDIMGDSYSLSFFLDSEAEIVNAGS